MPTYEYRCAKCGEDVEVYQSFSEKPLTKHAACGGKLTRVLSPAGIVLKGSGFYKTDNRTSAKKRGSSPADSNSGDSKSGDSKSGDSKSGDSKSADSKGGDSKSGESKPASGSSGSSDSSRSSSGSSSRDAKSA